MGRRKKIIFWLGGSVGAVLFLLLVLVLLAPKLINLEPIKEKVLASVSEEVGGEVKFQRFDLSFFPLPHVEIHQASLSIPGKVNGTLKSLKIYPRILPLLKGELQITEVQTETPEFQIRLPEKVQNRPEQEIPSYSVGIPIFAAQIIASLVLNAPNLVFEMHDGRVDLSEKDRSVFSFSNIDGRIVLPPKGFIVQLSCASNLWERIGVEATLNALDYKGKGHIKLTHFQPHRLTSHFFQNSTQRLTDSSMNMNVDLNVNGLNNVQAKVQGSIPLLSLQNGNGKSVIKGKSLKSLFRLDENEIAFSLAELNLEYPKVNLSGSFLLGRRTPKVKVELEGRDVDVLAVREVALAFAGDISDVQEIFGIVRGGKVPLVTVKSEGSTYDHLGDLKNILIKGHIVEGKILVPDMELDLADVKGNAVISEGVLHGENLEARLGNSWGREGKLKLALQGEDKAFHLDIGVQADLAELPPIMKRLIEDKVFQQEMSRIEDLKGNAVGRLVLGESTEAVKVRVNASEVNLSAKYKRMPFPFEISGGHFHYDGTKIGVKSLSGKVGNTSLNQLSASIDLEKELYVNVKSADIDFSDEEIVTWLKSIEGSPVRLEDIKSVKGNSRVTALELKGPLLSPGKWQIKTSYEPRGTVIDTTLLPGPIEITKGKFKGLVDPKIQELSFRDVQIRMLDASMNISGAVYDYLKGLNNLEVSLDGVVGPESNRWVSSLAHLPTELRLRSPLNISQGHLIWEKNLKTSFKGNLAVDKGPKVSLDILQTREEIAIKNFAVDDKVSQASMKIGLKEREFDFEFVGHLKKTTLNNLFVKSKFLHGWVEGDFRAHISLDHPMKSTAQGQLIGEDLVFPLELRTPLAIDAISLKAEKRHVDVERATLVSGSQEMDLEGSLDFSPPGLIFDMDVKSNGISWAQIEKLLNENGSKNESDQGKASWDLPLQGTVRLKSENFNYDRFTWIPFHADITFDRDEVDIAIIEAKICGISTPGSLKITPKDVSLDFQPAAKSQELQTTVQCVRGEEVRMTGKFDLEGKIQAQGKPERMVESLDGNFELLTGKGRIYRHVPLEKLFAYLNVLGIIKGQLSEMKEEGFAYDSISAKAGIQNGKVVIHEGIIDGLTMDITTQGNIDLVNKKIDLTVLVAPMKTVDTILKKIPIIRTITKEGLITVAVKVEGDLGEPKYRTLPASAVGSGLVGMMKRTVKLPFKVIELEPTGAEQIPGEREE